VFLAGPNALVILLSDGSGNCPTIQGNGTAGVYAQNGGAIVRASCATIQNNDTYGIFAILGATIQLFVPQANPGAIKLLNNLDGLVAVNGAHFNLSGPVIIATKRDPARKVESCVQMWEHELLESHLILRIQHVQPSLTNLCISRNHVRDAFISRLPDRKNVGNGAVWE